jgi:hypothetical protein
MKKYLVGVIALLALMFIPLGLAVGLPSTGGAGRLAVASPDTSAASGNCSKASALQVATRLQVVVDPTLPNPIAGVLCGAFAGPGSQVMIATFARGTCLPNYGWAAFMFSGGAWQLVPGGPRAGFVAALAAVGSDVRETSPVWRKDDGPCNPSGGTRSRIWHWNGTRFTASPWEQKTSGAPVKGAAFYSPSGGIQCGMGDDGKSTSGQSASVECWTLRSSQKATLYPGGRLIICRGSEARCKLANIGEAPTLSYGTQTTVGRFRCQSLQTGMRCTVIQSGKGFLINRDGVRRVG